MVASNTIFRDMLTIMRYDERVMNPQVSKSNQQNWDTVLYYILTHACNRLLSNHNTMQGNIKQNMLLIVPYTPSIGDSCN